MSQIDTCTLVLELNYGIPEKPLFSVWLFNGDGSLDLEQVDEGLIGRPNWVKVVGPIDQEIAITVSKGLKEFFEQCGVSVITDGIAD